MQRKKELVQSIKEEQDLLKNRVHPLWMYPSEDPEKRDKIVQEFHLHPVIANVLVSRGFETLDDIHYYLYAKLPDLHDPFLFVEMPKAVERIKQAVQNEENILIYGDNDVDGMTGTALLTEYLTFAGATVHYFVSNRSALLRQSMILDALEYALKTHCTLLITVDCGITAAKQIEEVVRHNIDVIITDHHEPTDTIPLCVATLNPKLVSSEYPNRELTGVGVAFKLICALTKTFLEDRVLPQKNVDLKRYLDLVAIGTVSDMGVLRGENRILVTYGLEQLKKTKRIGLTKLLAICETDLQDASTMVIASKIAPRLNSLGRIAEPEHGVKLLLERKALAAEKLAIELNLYNIERQKIERMMFKDVERMLAEKPEILQNRAICLWSRKWHPGIIAILAMRIAKMYNRPTVMIALDGQVGKGSVRSIPEFPVLPVLRKLSDLLLNFGGHDAACGLTIRESELDTFKKRFTKIANDALQEKHVTAKLYIDTEVRFDDLTFDLMESMRLLEPYGHGNQIPIFYADARQIQEAKVVGKQHLKFFLEQGDRMLEGIGIGLASRLSEVLAKSQKKNGSKELPNLRVAFTPQVSGSSIQLLVKDFVVTD